MANSEQIKVYESDMQRFLSDDEYRCYLAVTKTGQKQLQQAWDKQLRRVKQWSEEDRDKGVPLPNDIVLSLSGLVSIMRFSEEEENRYIDLVRQRKTVEINRPKVIEGLAIPMNDAERLLDPRDYSELTTCIDTIALHYASPEEIPNETKITFKSLMAKTQHGLEGEKREKLADQEWDKFWQGLNAGLTTVKRGLRQSKADFPLVLEKMEAVALGYRELVKQRDLLNWYDFKFRTPSKDFIDNLVKSALNEKVPSDVLPYITWETHWWDVPIPRSVEYLVVETVPCLVFGFDRYIVAEATVTVREGDYHDSFQDYAYEFRLNPVRLGFVLTEPRLYEESATSFIIPLVLLAGLARGDMEPDSTRIVSRSSDLTTYGVEGFEEEIAINDGFAKFLVDSCQGQTLAQGLLVKGLADSMTARIIQRYERLQLAAAPSSELSGGLSMYTIEELLGALARLGFSTKEAEAAIRALDMPKGVSLEEAVTFVLKHIGRKA